MKASSVEVWLWLLLVMSPHNPKTTELLEHYGSAEALARAIRDGSCPRINDTESHRARTTHTREVRQIMAECAEKGIRIITLDDEEYPTLLKNIYSPPIVLFVRGSLKCLSGEVSLSVVGPRHPSDYAVRVARMLCGDLVKLGTVLVSGLAVGIDTVAHSCSVNAGVPTVGILACGQLVNYPPENEGLKRRIIDGGGALVSELLPHTGVDSWYFRERNRIISGLGLGTLVVEASTRSGCLLTANHAVEQGRDLFCVPPGDITRESCAGVIPYLRDGAIPVFDYLDIVHEYMYHYFSRISPDDLSERLRRNTQKKRSAKPSGKAAAAGKNLAQSAVTAADTAKENPPETSATSVETPQEAAKPVLSEETLSALPEIQAKLAELIAKSPATADELVVFAEISYTDVAEALTELEIADIIQLTPEGNYEIKTS